VVASLLLAATVAAIVLTHTRTADAISISFTSDTSWLVYATDPDVGAVSIGNAAVTCPNSSPPPGCTAHNPGWSVNPPGASWIWAPGLPKSAPSDLAQFYFQKQLVLGAGLLSGSLSLAVDDFAEVRVNGTSVGTWGSTTVGGEAGLAQSMLKVFDLSPFLTIGINTVTIRSQNGPSSFVGCPVACTYAENPAGFILFGTVSDIDATPTLPPTPVGGFVDIVSSGNDGGGSSPLIVLGALFVIAVTGAGFASFRRASMR
jgi:hypothetical protein